MRSSFLAAFALISVLAAPLHAQMPPAPVISTDISTAAAGAYTLDKSHAAITFRIKHLGFSYYQGRYNDFDAKLNLDPAAPEKSSVEVTVKADSVDTNNAKLEGEIKDWFKVAQFAAVTFKSTKLTKTGATTGVMEGDLTMLGITKPIKLNVTFVGHGAHPMNKKATMGFSATGTIKRSEWGVSYGLPLVSDEVELYIDAEFNKADAPAAPAPAPAPKK